MYLYALARNKPVLVTLPTNPSQVVVTDGFHITKPVSLKFRTHKIFCFNVTCAISDDQLIVAFVITIVLYAMGATSGILLMQVLSLAPIFYILFLYYINRKDFIKLQLAE